MEEVALEEIYLSDTQNPMTSFRPCLRGPLDREHGKSVETMFQSEWQHIYKICRSLLGKLHRKKSLLVIHKILRLFVNTLTGNDKH